MAEAHRHRASGSDLRGSGGLRIAVIYDGGADDWSTEDIQSVLAPVRAVARILKAAGHEVVRVRVRPDLAWLNAVREVDLVFNLCEGIGGASHLEYKVASAIELARVPYTGAKAWTMTVCHRKPLVNAVLQAADLPIPSWAVPVAGNGLVDFPLPALVKPAAEDASVGIDQRSVVTTQAELRSQVERLLEQFAEVMVQRYVHGRELAVGFVGAETLPISEIDFSEMPGDAWPILSFNAKWSPGCAEDIGTTPVCPARLCPELARRVTEVATRAWETVRGAGYGRVDLRIDAEGQPWIIEVNPNPDISMDAGLTRMARARGWSYTDLVLQIVDDAVHGGVTGGQQEVHPASVASGGPH